MFSPLRLIAQRGVASRAVSSAVARGVTSRCKLRASPTTTATTTCRRFFSEEAKEAEPPKPSAFDVVVQLTFVDPNGARRQVPGYVGKNLHETCEMHGIDIGPAFRAGDPEIQRSERWMEPTFGEGPACGFDHVILYGNGVETAHPRSDRELSLISEYWDDDEVYDESRLACMVNITKEMDGMIVYVPDRLVCDIP